MLPKRPQDQSYRDWEAHAVNVCAKSFYDPSDLFCASEAILQMAHLASGLALSVDYEKSRQLHQHVSALMHFREIEPEHPSALVNAGYLADVTRFKNAVLVGIRAIKN